VAKQLVFLMSIGRSLSTSPLLLNRACYFHSTRLGRDDNRFFILSWHFICPSCIWTIGMIAHTYQSRPSYADHHISERDLKLHGLDSRTLIYLRMLSIPHSFSVTRFPLQPMLYSHLYSSPIGWHAVLAMIFTPYWLDGISVPAFSANLAFPTEEKV